MEFNNINDLDGKNPVKSIFGGMKSPTAASPNKRLSFMHRKPSTRDGNNADLGFMSKLRFRSKQGDVDLKSPTHLKPRSSLEEERCQAILSDLNVESLQDRPTYDHVLDAVEGAEEAVKQDIIALESNFQNLRNSIRLLKNSGDKTENYILRKNKVLQANRQRKVSMSNGAVRIFDSFHVIGPDLSDFLADKMIQRERPTRLDPRICYSFCGTRNSGADNVEQFCFPKGIPTRAIEELDGDYKFFVFVISGGGKYGQDTKYACCMYKWIPLPSLDIEDENLYVRVCYAVIASMPYISLFSKVLRHLLDAGSQDTNNSSTLRIFSEKQSEYSDIVLGNLISYKIPELGQSRCLRIFPSDSCPLIFSRNPPEHFTDEEAMLLLRWGLPLTLKQLSVRHILKVLGCIMVEMRIIIACDDVEILSATVLTLTSLLRPLRWAGALVTILPPFINEYLEAPVPYVIGVQELPSHVTLTPGMVILDANKNTLQIHADDMKNISSYQVPEAETLSSDLERHGYAFRDPSMSAGILAKTASLEAIIRTLRFHVKLIIDTCDLLSTTGDGNNRSELLEAIGKSSMPFIERLCSTQHYQSFMDEHKRVIHDISDTKPRNTTSRANLIGAINEVFAIAVVGTSQFPRFESRRALLGLSRSGLVRRRLKSAVESERRFTNPACKKNPESKRSEENRNIKRKPQSKLSPKVNRDALRINDVSKRQHKTRDGRPILQKYTPEKTTKVVKRENPPSPTRRATIDLKQNLSQLTQDCHAIAPSMTEQAIRTRSALRVQNMWKAHRSTLNRQHPSENKSGTTGSSEAEIAISSTPSPKEEEETCDSPKIRLHEGFKIFKSNEFGKQIERYLVISDEGYLYFKKPPNFSSAETKVIPIRKIKSVQGLPEGQGLLRRKYDPCNIKLILENDPSILFKTENTDDFDDVVSRIKSLMTDTESTVTDTLLDKEGFRMKLKSRLLEGLPVLKHGRTGKPKHRHLSTDSTFSSISWGEDKRLRSSLFARGGGRRAFDLSDLIRVDKLCENPRVLSIVTKHRSLKIETVEEEDYALILHGLK